MIYVCLPGRVLRTSTEMSGVLTNRHVVVALLVAPVLAVLAWFAAGELFGEKPHRAVAGQAYPLVARSNCRYDSGVCDLHNEDMRLTLGYQQNSDGSALLLTSQRTLSFAMAAVAAQKETAAPVPMVPLDNSGKRWSLELVAVPPRERRLLIVVEAAGSRWYGDASSAFLEPFRQ